MQQCLQSEETICESSPAMSDSFQSLSGPGDEIATGLPDMCSFSEVHRQSNVAIPISRLPENFVCSCQCL